MRPVPGTIILYAPGERTLLPRLYPTHARGSMVVLEYWLRGFTANALQPKGMMDMIRGFVPVSISYDVGEVVEPSLVGPDVRLRTSTAISIACVQCVMPTFDAVR